MGGGVTLPCSHKWWWTEWAAEASQVVAALHCADGPGGWLSDSDSGSDPGVISAGGLIHVLEF